MSLPTRNKGKNLSYLRTSNQAAVLKHLATKGCCSRVELSKLLSLTKMSISYIVGDLVERGIIEECDPTLCGEVQNHTVGRKPSMLQVRANCIQAIGVYVARNRIHCSLSDITQTQLASVVYPTSAVADKTSLISVIQTGIRTLLANDHAKKVVGIGLGCIGLIDSKRGIIEDTTDFFGIRGIPVRDLLQSEFDLPVYAANDMKASALCEHLYGAARGINNFVYMGVTSGIGSGIIVNGRLFEGSSGFSSEFGHLSINPTGELCPCGNHGCLELYASVPVLLRKSGCSTWPEFLSKAHEPGSTAQGVFDRFLSDLGIALINIANLFDPEVIVLGHEASQLSPEDILLLEDMLNNGMMTRRFKHTPVVTSSFGQDTPIIGTTSLVYARIFSGEIRI